MSISKEMRAAIISRGREIFDELINDPEVNSGRDVMGASQEVDFTFEGKLYQLEIDAFWEKSNYFDYDIKGHGLDEYELVAAYI